MDLIVRSSVNVFFIGNEAIIIHKETWLFLILIQVAPQSNTWARKSMSRESGLQSTAMLSWYSFLCPDLCYHWFSQSLTKRNRSEMAVIRREYIHSRRSLLRVVKFNVTKSNDLSSINNYFCGKS